MEIMLRTLREGLPQLGLQLDEDRINTLCQFGCGVVKQNEVMNLTAITESAQVAKLHLLDYPFSKFLSHEIQTWSLVITKFWSGCVIQ